MNVLIAAAGTGGHINPGIAIANEIKSRNKEAQITFVGTVRGLENDLVPRSGYKLEVLDAYGIERKVSVENIKNIFKTLKSYRMAKKLMDKVRPDIVIGTGGYICGPVFSAAKRKKIPTVLHESNAFPGITVKVLANSVTKVLVGFEEAKKRLKNAENVTVTGTPSRINMNNYTPEEIIEIKKEHKLKEDLPIVLVFGGSQGAKTINNAVVDIIKTKKNKDYQIIWACGAKQFDVIKEEFEREHINIRNIENTTIVPYLYKMEKIMNISDLIVCRSGAMTITEVISVGKPCIFIPFPNATANHQEYNAKVLVEKDAAKIILDKDLNMRTLSRQIDLLIKNKDKLKIMGENAKKLKMTNVEQNIYKEIMKAIK
jgi:UDP-N-acetylglucosamine--N-acetylmuramyl-(pentapeptide) pyrophosphoryl-undecaprenol N-acetylglucosamine transferase